MPPSSADSRVVPDAAPGNRGGGDVLRVNPGSSAERIHPRSACPPRDGRPDLQGVWNFATITPLQRPAEYAGREMLTADEVAQLEDRAVRNEFVDRQPAARRPWRLQPLLD